MAATIGVTSKGQGNGGASTAGVTTQATGSTFYVSATLGQTALTPVPTIADTIGGSASGNVWTEFQSTADTAGRAVFEWYCQNGAGGANHVVTITATVEASVYFGEAKGCVTTGGPDQQNAAGANFPSGGTLSSGNITLTPAASGEAIFSTFSTQIYPTATPSINNAGSALTSFLQSYTDSTSGASGGFAAGIVTSSATYKVIGSDSGNNAFVTTIVAFQGAGSAENDGTAAITEGSDTAAGTGTVAVTASGAITEGADIAAGAGTVAVTGSGAITEGNDTVSGVGTVAVSGNAAITEGNDTAAGTGTVAVTGSGAIAENADTASGAGTVAVVSGTDNINEGADTVAGVGAVGENDSGPDNINEPPDGCVGVGFVPGALGGGAQRRRRTWDPQIVLALQRARVARELREVERTQQQLLAERKVRLKQLARKRVEPTKVARQLDDIATALAKISARKVLALAEKERITREIEQEQRQVELKRIADEAARIEAQKTWEAGQAHLRQMREESEAAEAMLVLMMLE